MTLLPGGCAVVTPWVDEAQITAFCAAWGVGATIPPWLFLQRDRTAAGCGATKNAGVRRAREAGAEVVVVLDDDCFPDVPGQSLEELAAMHVLALEPQPVELFETLTDPPSRGTPYAETTATMPVACSMGFWREVGDYCAPRQLAFGATHPMTFRRGPMFGRWFPLCGMNMAFRPTDWSPWCSLIDVPRFDDIWMGWLWQKEAYRRGACFNLSGPIVRHSRQSNVWRNLREEARFLEQSEILWRTIALSPLSRYEDLRALLPLPGRD